MEAFPRKDRKRGGSSLLFLRAVVSSLSWGMNTQAESITDFPPRTCHQPCSCHIILFILQFHVLFIKGSQQRTACSQHVRKLLRKNRKEQPEVGDIFQWFIKFSFVKCALLLPSEDWFMIVLMLTAIQAMGNVVYIGTSGITECAF